MKDFFISYSRVDLQWAEWIRSVLKQNHFTVDFPPRAKLIVNDPNEGPLLGRERCRCTLAVVSPSYFTTNQCTDEWNNTLVENFQGTRPTLFVVRLENIPLSNVPGHLPTIDLFDVGDNELLARQRLTNSVVSLANNWPDRRTPTVPFPVSSAAQPPVAQARFPGALPKAWNVPHDRNPNFTGRGELLERLREELITQRHAAITQAIYGLGGVGKTQLAVEYAYRHRGDYDYVLWVRSEEPGTRASDYAALAGPLGLPEKDAKDQRQIIAAVTNWLGRNPGWFLVLDNVPHPDDIDGLIPQGAMGHVIVTSRDPNWRGQATPLKVEVFDRPVSVEFLVKRTGGQPADTGPKRERGSERGY